METRLKKVVLINIGLILLLFLYYQVYITFNIGIPCIFKLITGLDCPGCGITRCLFSLINLDINKAFQYNALVTILIIPFTVYYLYLNYCYVLDKPNKIKNIEHYISFIILILMILFGIYRNIN